MAQHPQRSGAVERDGQRDDWDVEVISAQRSWEWMGGPSHVLWTVGETMVYAQDSPIIVYMFGKEKTKCFHPRRELEYD